MSLKKLFDEQIVTLATQPKNNYLDIAHLKECKQVYLIAIDHDYPGASAAMHNAVFAKVGLPYRTFFVVSDPKNVKVIVETMREDPLCCGGGMGSGFKDKVVEYLDELDDSAKVIGSVNMIAKRNGRLVGFNTDGVGFYQGLVKEYPDAVKDKTVVILGAGGTALPIAYELARVARQVVVVNRTVDKAKRIAELIQPFTKAVYGGEEELGAFLASADVVVNTSNKGAQPHQEWSAFGPLTGNLENDTRIAYANLSRLRKGAIVADVLLEKDTKTLQMAREQGFRTHNGMHMNLYQAIPYFKKMTGIVSLDDATLETVMSEARK